MEENKFTTKAILVKENLEDGKIWSLYEDTEDMEYICWTKTKKEALQYAKENNIKITN